jgi:hypothetical protein
MNKRIVSFGLVTALALASSGCWADNVNATGNDNNPVTHPVNAYNNHEVKEDMQDSQQNSDKAAESRAAFKQAKADYEKSLKANGKDSPVTQDARKRMIAARKDMGKYSQKATNANRELKKDETKAQQ